LSLLKSLVILYLADNELEVLLTDEFSGLSYLQYLDLSNNNRLKILERLAFPFEIQALILRNVSVELIHHVDFQVYPKIEEVDLSLSDFRLNTLKVFSEIIVLSLAGSKINPGQLSELNLNSRAEILDFLTLSTSILGFLLNN
jgi:Leucine-rich repeat (LRR) protein